MDGENPEERPFFHLPLPLNSSQLPLNATNSFRDFLRDLRELQQLPIDQGPIVASNRNRIGKEVIETEHGPSQITFYENYFIAGPTGEIVAEADDKTEAVLVA